MVLPTRPYTLSSYASIPSASHDINTIARVQEFKISAELLISLQLCIDLLHPDWNAMNHLLPIVKDTYTDSLHLSADQLTQQL